jgi:hypothetical protein
MTRLIAGNKQIRLGQPDAAAHRAEMASFHQDSDGLRLERDQLDKIAGLSGAVRGGLGGKFEGLARAPYDGREAPGAQLVTDAEDVAAAVEEDDIDGKAHEKHVHPHERDEWGGNEEHPGA